jgi:hypothetical protein
MCTAISGLPIKHFHEDTLIWLMLVEADYVVNGALQAKTKHTCHHGGGDNTSVD